MLYCVWTILIVHDPHSMIKYIKQLSLFVFVVVSAHAQHMDKKQVHDLILSKHFAFKAEYVMPMGAPSKFLTSEYDLRIHGDSLISDLPYFGRAYVAPAPGTEGGIKFTSTDYSYKAKQKKKGRWEITLQPTEAGIKSELVLDVYENGTARLMVNSSDRQAISYTGFIRK
jgi:hypothetical protein